MLELKESLDHQLNKLIEQADGIEQELVYATLNRDQANAQVKALEAHIKALNNHIGAWKEGVIEDSEMMKHLFKWANKDIEVMKQEAADAVQ